MDAIPMHYPGHVMRLYTDVTPDMRQMRRICELACTRPHLDICLVQNLPGNPAVDLSAIVPGLWKLLALIDPQVKNLLKG